MSAFVVSKAQIDVLVAGGAQVIGDECTPEHLSLIGQRLLEECVRSVSYRYPNDDLGELPGCYVQETIAPGVAPLEFAEWLTPYAWAAGELRPTKQQILEELGCYEYQSCEHPGWEGSWSYKYCAGLRAAVQGMPDPQPEPKPQPEHDYGSLGRDDTIKRIRTALRRRSGKAWSVTGGRGTAYGWITITAPPKRRVGYGYMSEADQRELAELLGKDRPVHCQGETIPASSEYRREYIDRAEGRMPSEHGVPYWD